MKRLIIPDIHHRVERAELILAAEPADEVYFLGDYQDDFGDSPSLARATAEFTKRQIEAGHRMLWGNHDLPYAYPGKRHGCPGFTPAKSAAIGKILTRDHWKRLRLWYVIPDSPRPWILSHAGIDRYWLEGAPDPLARLQQLEAEALDSLHKGRSHPVIFSCAASRNGPDPYPGVLWMDWGDFRPVPGLNQIVGHTPLRNPDEFSQPDSINWCVDTHLNHYAVLEDGKLTLRRAPRS